jgi:prepilin-type processing-associated H-X9-DG protein
MNPPKLLGQKNQCLARTGAAFSRLEALVIVISVFLLGTLALPLFGATHARSRLAQCFNNLRQIGAGFHGVSMQMQDRTPWHLQTSDGGTRNSPFVANAFVHFSVLSNFTSPHILTCPSDVAKRTARDFGNGPDGFMSLGNRDNVLSYIIGCEAEQSSPRQILSGDRNIRVSGFQNCGTVNVPALALIPNDPTVAWTNYHNASGNLLFVDGSVSTLTSSGLRDAVRRTSDGLGDQASTTHILLPAFPTSVPE